LLDRYGGDPRKIVLVGQSAGAHIGSCILISKIHDAAVINKNDESDTLQKIASWRVSDLRGFIPVSGPYDLITMRNILHQHGLDKGILDVMFCNDLERYSPTCTLLNFHRDSDNALFDNSTKQKMHNLLRLKFPPTCIIHGKTDRTVPFTISVNFFSALSEAKVQNTVDLKLYENWGHTDPILEAPFSGDHTFHRDVYDLVTLWTTNKTSAEDSDPSAETSSVTTYAAFDQSHPACQKICPSMLVALGRFFNPF
jgi:prenylcysteine alpha-carboxyl methylesterase